MGINKQYDGYRSYQYLQPGIDYQDFEFPEPPTEWAEPYIYPVSDDEEARVQKLLRNNLVVSIHDHPIMIPKNVEELIDLNQRGRAFTAYEALSHSGIDCLWDNLLDGMASITSKAGWKWQDVLFDLGMRLCDVGHQSFLLRCEGIKDVYKAFEENKIGWVPALESASMIENELDRLDILYGFGIRSIGIVYNESNTLGTGLKEKRDGGLTAFGLKAIERMNKLGIIIDVSHASDLTALNAIEVSEHPIVVSHAGARALWPSHRLKPDEVLLAMAEKGGVVGIEAAPHTTLTSTHPIHTIESVMEHFEYCARLLGIDYVTFGPDTIYGNHVGLHHVYRKRLSVADVLEGTPEYEEVPYVKGMENPGECFPNAVRWLVSHGYSDGDIARVIGGNTLRVMKEIWWN